MRHRRTRQEKRVAHCGAQAGVHRWTKAWDRRISGRAIGLRRQRLGRRVEKEKTRKKGDWADRTDATTSPREKMVLANKTKQK